MAITLDRPTQLTKLDAVNAVLEARGGSPVASPGASRAAVEAENTLALWSMVCQTERKWNFNTDEKLTLSPNVSGEINLPEDLHLFEPIESSWGMDLADRGGRLYDRSTSTFVFTSDVYVRATYILPFDDLPSPARWYVTIKAAFQVGNQETPGNASLRVDKMHVDRAKASLESYDRALGPKTLRYRNDHFRRQRGRR